MVIDIILIVLAIGMYINDCSILIESITVINFIFLLCYIFCIRGLFSYIRFRLIISEKTNKKINDIPTFDRNFYEYITIYLLYYRIWVSYLKIFLYLEGWSIIVGLILSTTGLIVVLTQMIITYKQIKKDGEQE